ncbi:hypothetical protein PUN28_016039 [Cardiocondyla obscurior]|uniref:Uncharacterized protein n=1 Tax=Cardiocondyla obscurior TaxID=286306 RepID=A0AAW2ERT8_9HYME
MIYSRCSDLKLFTTSRQRCSSLGSSSSRTKTVSRNKTRPNAVPLALRALAIPRDLRNRSASRKTARENRERTTARAHAVARELTECVFSRPSSRADPLWTRKGCA